MADESVPPPAAAPVAAAQQTPAAPQSVTVPYSEFQALMALPGRLAEFEARSLAAVQAEQEKAVQALVGKGQAEDAVKTLRSQLEGERDAERAKRADAEKRALSFARDTELAKAISNHPIRPGMAPMLMELVAKHLEAHPDGDGFTVRTATFQSAADFVAETLKKPEFGGFLAPSTQGGAGASTAQGETPPPAGGLSPEQQIVAAWHANKAAAFNGPSWAVPTNLTRRN